LLVGYCISQFARRMAAAGSLYSFTAKGLEPTAAIVSGVGLALGYALLSMSTLLLTAFYFLQFAHRAALVVPTAVVVVISLGGVAAFCMIRGISVSSRVVLVVESVSIAGILVVLAVLVVRHGVHLDTRLLRASGSSAHGIGRGVALTITSFVGFESSAALGAEARRPHQSVPRAVMRTALGAGVLYRVSAYTQLDGFGGSASGLAARTTPLTDLADLAGIPWLSLVLDLGIAASDSPARPDRRPR
jgi:amino acid transporter